MGKFKCNGSHPKEAEDALWADSKESHNPASYSSLYAPSKAPLPLQHLTSHQSHRQCRSHRYIILYFLLPSPIPVPKKSANPSVLQKDSFANLQDNMKQAIFKSSVLHILMVQPKDFLRSQAHLISWLSCTYSQVSLVSSCTKDPSSLHIQTSVHPLFLP